GVYGGRRDGVLRESDPLVVNPALGFYLGSKLCAEIQLQDYRSFFKTGAILRPFFVYGPGQKADMLVARLIESVRHSRPVQLHGSNGLRLNPVFVEDAAAAFAAALDLTGWHVINIAGPNTLTLREICEKIGSILNRKPIFENTDTPPTD